jgi:hypothetical protein
MADRFLETPCEVSISNNYDTCGTITRASVAHLTPDQLESLFKPEGLFADMDVWFRTSFEMKACGTRTNGMYEWLMSSQKNLGHLVNTTKIDKGPSLVAPFVLGRQDSVINNDFWAITGGVAQSGYTPDDLTNAGTGAISAGPLTTAQKALGAAGDRVVRVISRYGVELTANWFVSKDRVLILGLAAGGQSTRGQWKVLAAAANTAGTYVDVLLHDENSGSATAYDIAPVAGVLLAMGNNVNDYESWCYNRPTLDPRHRVPFWYQTMRRTRCVNSEYRKVFARLMESNKYFEAFGDLPLAERNRQDEEEYQHRWVNSFFFGKKISANQTLANWQSLEQITTVTGVNADTTLSGNLIAYRANMVGVYEQLKACGRVRDLQNNLLNFYEFLDEIYNIYRARKSQGKQANSIDVYTDSVTAANFETAAMNYYKAEYGDILRIDLDITEGENAVLGFGWRSYKFKRPLGVRVNIIVHEFFDDLLNAGATENIGSSTRFMMILDMGRPGTNGGTIYPGMIATNMKKRTHGELEQMARVDSTVKCVMEVVTEEFSLMSESVTAVLSCPANSLIITGLADGIPTTQGREGADYTNLY